MTIGFSALHGDLDTLGKNSRGPVPPAQVAWIPTRLLDAMKSSNPQKLGCNLPEFSCHVGQVLPRLVDRRCLKTKLQCFDNACGS